MTKDKLPILTIQYTVDGRIMHILHDENMIHLGGGITSKEFNFKPTEILGHTNFIINNKGVTKNEYGEYIPRK